MIQLPRLYCPNSFLSLRHITWFIILYSFSVYDKYLRPNKKESILHFHEFHSPVCVNMLQHEKVKLTRRGIAP
jgi:hypothetical protein